MKKRIMTGNSEIEIDDIDPIERMRHRDTDGDGVVDYIDSNGYSKPSDKYRYKEVSSEEYRKLQDAGFNHESQPSKTNPNNRIIRFTESQTADIDRILSPALRRGVMK